MRADILFCLLIVCFQTESVLICDICDCQDKKQLPLGLVVNCTLRENVLELNTVLPDKSVTLDLSCNNLTNIQPTSLFQSITLEELLLNRNYLNEVNLYSFRLPQLRRLDLSENELRILGPNLFKGFTKLEYLNLANNKFTAGSQLSFNSLVSLREIILDNNNIGDDLETRSLFDANGFGLPLSVQSISISGVNLNNLNLNYFKPVAKTLKKLIISNNNLTVFVRLPQNLEYLDFSNNPIRNITSDDFPMLEPLVNLRVLKLNNLDIQEIPENIFSTVMLRNLELKNNKNLKEFSNVTFGRQLVRDTYDYYLENLTLKGSNLSTLDKGLSFLFEKIKRLDLQQNPWICDCRLAWIRQLSIDTDLTDDLRCTTPPYLHNKRIFELDEDDFVCLKSWWNETQLGVAVGFVFYLLLVFVTFGWIYVFIYHPAPKVNRQEYSRL